LAIGLASGKALAFETTPAYVLSLGYLAILGSIAAFASYLTLLKRIGAARAGYSGVMVPILALLLSRPFEGFRFHALTWLGIGGAFHRQVVAEDDSLEAELSAQNVLQPVARITGGIGIDLRIDDMRGHHRRQSRLDHRFVRRDVLLQDFLERALVARHGDVR